jgi:hypothetical protein
MRMPLLVLASICLASSVCTAQTNPSGVSPPPKEGSKATDMKPHHENIQQTPQGESGPLNTTTGGAPAESPQGQTPPGMQAAPKGSSQTIMDTHRK